MPDLPPVSESFDADASGFLSALQEMIDRAEELASAIQEDIGKIAELRTAINSLPDTKVVNVIYKVTTEGAAKIVENVAKGGVVENISLGKTQDIVQVASQMGNLADKTEEAARAQETAAAAARIHDNALARLERQAAQVNQAMYAMQLELKDIAAAEKNLADVTSISVQQLMEEEYQIARIEEAMGDAPRQAALGILELAQAAAAAGGAGGTIRLLGTGLTLTAAAIHMLVMGTLEFLAVFIPAMYAAAAGAYVMLQGVQLVQHQVTGLYTAAEALGPMFSTTAGDMLGLGHSMQTAQDLANPGVYELLGEAIAGVRTQTQMVTPHLSSFGQLGLDVTHMLDAFGARFVIDLQDNADKIRQLLGAALDDLRMFGQILGNFGHAIMNFAAAMPGLAEIILKIIDGISALIKWLSSLPAPLLTVIFIFEEMYRWSGALVAIFGVIGRAIALLGTLGIPVLLRIGQNFGAMVAAIVTGAGDAVVNFVAMGERIGVFGARIDAAATGIVGALGRAAAFMTGPWGIALGLGAIAVGALVVAIMHAKSATDVLVDGINKTVQSASNLNVLNQIASGLTSTAGATKDAVSTLGSAMDAANRSAGRGKFEFESYAGSVYAAGVPVGQLTAEQQKLHQETLNVIAGAAYISRTYRVDFVSALAMADMAGVKLVNGLLGQSDAARQARLQLASMVDAYQRLDQSGTTLANTMDAINIQAGLQASKVSQVNQAWDNFIQMSAGLTGTFAQFNADLQQMGNVAPAVGSRIRAFSGQTQLSVAQIAQALTSFSGKSSQIWLSFNQSVSQANSFMDQLRIAAAAGVVPQQQFIQAIASVVAQLLPYSRDSRAARAEISALAQEAGGPATTSYKALKDWTDRNKVSAHEFSGMIDNLTAKLSNVTQVARNFAGTLQSDVLNAIANGATAVSGVTQLTKNYTQSLMDNGAQAAPTRQAQQALNRELHNLGFTLQDVRQLDQELTSAYDKNATGANANRGATGLLAQAMDAARKVHMDPFGQAIRNITSWYSTMQSSLANWPTRESTTVSVHATGGASVKSSVAGVPGGTVTVGGVASRFAGGGVLPGYAPGHDSVLAMLSPGEGVLTPQAVRMIGPGSVEALNRSARRFAEGGLVLPDIAGWANRTLGTGTASIAVSFGEILTSAVTSVLTGTQKAVSAMSAGQSIPGHPKGDMFSWIARAMALTGVPQSWMSGLLTIAAYESGYNPNAINLSDINAARGDPSRGLMQLIMSNFLAYHQAGTSFNIYDPVANIAAAIRYIEARYGSIGAVPGIVSLARGGPYVGYDSGGLLMPGLTMAFNGTGRPERVVAPSGAGEATVIHNVVNIDGRKIFEAVKPVVYQYNSRNSGNGNINGTWRPR